MTQIRSGSFGLKKKNLSLKVIEKNFRNRSTFRQDSLPTTLSGSPAWPKTANHSTSLQVGEQGKTNTWLASQIKLFIRNYTVQ